MRTSTCSEEQVISFLNQAEARLPIKELCRKGGFSDATFYKFNQQRWVGKLLPPTLLAGD